MTILLMPAWLPDQPSHNNPGLITCKNVIARTERSYGPFRDLAEYSNALAARCQGAYAARDSGGNVNIFAGDATTLKRLSSASPNFEDVSRTAGGAYATGAEEAWRFAQYGDRVIATNFGDDLQSYQFGVSSDFTPLAAAAPKGKYLAIWRDFLVLGHLQGFAQRVRWPAIDDATNWPTIGSAAAAAVQSDQQDLVGDGGMIQGLAGGLANADGVVFQERALFRVTYVGPPLIFSFDQLEGGRGTPIPGSIAQLGGLVFYIGEDGFYAFDGASSQPIGAEILDKTFFDDLDQTYSARISSAVDPINKIVYWSYPGASNVAGLPNRVLAFNWSLKRWSLIEISSELIFRAGTFGYNLDGAAITGYNVDSSPFGPDSRFWAGGKSILAGFSAAHKLGFFSGNTLAATIETGDLDLGEGQRSFITGLRPIIDTDQVTAGVRYRDTLSANPSDPGLTLKPPGADGFCPQRISTRFARAQIQVSAGATWTHLSGIEPRAQAEGTR